LLKDAGLTGSTSDAMRMIQQGAVKLNGEKIEDKNLKVQAGTEGVFKVGKRKFARITVH
jgi:tyrosyl-tRNA synthetase